MERIRVQSAFANVCVERCSHEMFCSNAESGCCRLGDWHSFNPVGGNGYANYLNFLRFNLRTNWIIVEMEKLNRQWNRINENNTNGWNEKWNCFGKMCRHSASMQCPQVVDLIQRAAVTSIEKWLPRCNNIICHKSTNLNHIFTTFS